MKSSTCLLTELDIKNAIDFFAQKIIKTLDHDHLVLLGISDTGYCLAQRLVKRLNCLTELEIPCGQLDINLFLPRQNQEKKLVSIKQSMLPCNLRDKRVVLIDSCLQTGQSIVAALNALSDYDKARCIEIAVLCDIQHYQFPIKPTYVYKQEKINRFSSVSCQLYERDGQEGVFVS